MLTFTITNEWIDKGHKNVPLVYSIAFLEKEENMDELWNLALVVQDIDYICMWEEKLQSDQFKQCIQIKKTNSLLNLFSGRWRHFIIYNAY